MFYNCFSLYLLSSIAVFVNADRIKRSPILGGNEAQPNQFPYAAALISPGKEVTCTGGIISERHVLLAAHCVVDERKKTFKTNTWKVITGTNNYKTDPNATAVDVKQIFIPSDYMRQGDLFDVAILQLAEHLKINKNHLQILQLPVDLTTSLIGKKGVVTGFGACQVSVSLNGTRKIVESKTFDGKLRSAKVEIIDRNQCPKIPTGKGESRLRDYHFLAKMMKKSRDVFGFCYGDSGSPFVYKTKTILGIMVGGFDDACDGRILPSIFIKVESFANFMNDVLSGNVTRGICVKNLGNNNQSNCNIL